MPKAVRAGAYKLTADYGKSEMHNSWIIVTAAFVVALCAAASAVGADAAPGSGPVVVERKGMPGAKVACWLETSLKRVFPLSKPGNRTSLSLVSPRNATASFQVCYQNQSISGLTVQCTVEAPDGVAAQVRRVGYVPQRNLTAGVALEDQDGLGFIPGLVPDPLFPEQQAVTGPQGTQSFWVTLRISSDASVGTHALTAKLTFGEDSVSLPVHLDIRSLVVKPRKDFPVTHWWNADGIYDYYKVDAFGDDWFRIVEPYLRNMVSHGSNVIFVPTFHHRREVVQRPAQLLIVNKVGDGKYQFDWSRVKRFVDLAKQCGFEEFEWPHFWHMNIQPTGAILSCAEPQRVYTFRDGKAELVIPADAPATGEAYVTFLKQFLPEFQRFLQQEKLDKISWYHVSDEPEGKPEDIKNFKDAHELLLEMAPWMKGRVLDAISPIEYGRQRLVDYPIPNVAAAAAYRAEGIPHWVYYCCGPKGSCLNRFFDTPLAKLRMGGFLYYKLEALGFLHWGFNFWYVMDLGFNPVPQNLIDPFADGAVGTSAGGEGEPYGDSFVVYPGADGKPMDSIRWEVFAESLQDYAILQTAGIKPDDPMLASLTSYCGFPYSEEWIETTLGTILSK